jgi:hypothetical protein
MNGGSRPRSPQRRAIASRSRRSNQTQERRDITLTVLQREPELTLARSDQPFEYQISDAIAKRLLMPPAATNSNTSKTNETADKRR